MQWWFEALGYQLETSEVMVMALLSVFEFEVMDAEFRVVQEVNSPPAAGQPASGHANETC